MTQKVKDVIRRLQRFPDNAQVYAYEGEEACIVVWSLAHGQLASLSASERGKDEPPA